jgi:hypothetical protein
MIQKVEVSGAGTIQDCETDRVLSPATQDKTLKHCDNILCLPASTGAESSFEKKRNAFVSQLLSSLGKSIVQSAPAGQLPILSSFRQI